MPGTVGANLCVCPFYTGQTHRSAPTKRGNLFFMNSLTTHSVLCRRAITKVARPNMLSFSPPVSPHPFKKMKTTRKIQYLFFISITFCLSSIAHADSLGDKNRNIDCPKGIYKGKTSFIFNDKNLNPTTSMVDDMLFFYGEISEKLPWNQGALKLKSVMICSSSGKKIVTATKHIGKYTFLNKECDVSLNGKGRINNKNLLEQGEAKLICKDKSTYSGTYSITATKFNHLFLKEN